MKELDFQQITLVGTGLLGGSVGLALRGAGYRGKIIGTGSRLSTLDTAKSLGCIDDMCEDLAVACRASDLVLIAAPVGKISTILAQLDPVIEPHSVVTDVGSTKSSIVATASSLPRMRSRFVGSHPMAGAETTGPQSARADLFRDKPVIVTPTADTASDALVRVESLWGALGMKTFRMSGGEHDRLVAVISHLPHAVAVLLVNLAKQNGALPVASTGFADTTRLALGDAELWADIFLDNRASVSSALSQVAKMAGDLNGVIQSGDRNGLLRLLREARETRQAWRGTDKGVG